MKNITTTERHLGYDGFEIAFIHEFEEGVIEIDKFKSGDLLQSAGIIDEYKNHMVLIDGTWIEWEEFVDTANLQEEEYEILVRTWLLKQTCKRINKAA